MRQRLNDSRLFDRIQLNDSGLSTESKCLESIEYKCLESTEYKFLESTEYSVSKDARDCVPRLQARIGEIH